MQLLTKFSLIVIILFFSLKGLTKKQATKQIALPNKTEIKTEPSAKIQAAILLDVSGSMQGLIEQAKTQLWTMVNTMGRVRCNGRTPEIEIALYEYGRPSNGSHNGYIKQLSPFTNNLDELSKTLFSLRTDGGDEYCGQVIYSAMQQLNWDNNPSNYKVIFIAGNEDFLQGKVHFTKACNLAKQKGVIVNTIFCGDLQTGILQHWNLLGECGNGSYTHINHNSIIDDIETPYDSILLSMNGLFNQTYMAYNNEGRVRMRGMAEVDQLNFNQSRSAAIKRGKAKNNAAVYKNSWDLIERYEANLADLKNIDKNELPDSLKTSTTTALQQLVVKKSLERKNYRKQIDSLNYLRDIYLTNVKSSSTNGQKENLESAIEKIIKTQVQRFKMVLK